MDHDIVISGGGIAGLTAAAAFGAQGFSVLCVDPAPPVTDREAEGADLRSSDLGSLKLADASRFKGAIISKQQAASLLSGLGLKVV